MKTSFSTAIHVDQTPQEVFNAIINVRGWWSEEIEGATDKLNDEFIYRYKDVHYCKAKLTEVIPGKRWPGLFWTTISILPKTQANG